MTVQIAGYEILDEVGQANYGTLYRATSAARPKPVLLKILDRSATDYEFRRLSNEIRLYAQLESPHLAEILDAGYSDGVLYYVMASYDGTLADRPTDAGTTLQVIADAARGADALHEIGIAHRDIRPETVAVDAGRGHLIDLGLAQVLPGGDASAFGPRGAPDYVAPEVAMGYAATRTSDVWSLGLTLHASLSNAPVRPPITATGVLDRLRHTVAHPPVIDQELPAAIRAVLNRCLEEAPERRYPTAAALADALEGVGQEMQP